MNKLFRSLLALIIGLLLYHSNALAEDTRILSFGSHLKFGEVQVGESRTKELILYNKGDSPLHINGIRFHENLDGVYSGNWSGTVAPDSSKSITITFIPKEAKLYSGLVYVNSDKTNTTRENSRLLTGTGVRLIEANLTISLPLNPPNCKGRIIKHGIDNNHNGVLDNEEIISTVEQYDEGVPIDIQKLRDMVASEENITQVNTCKITDMSYLFSGEEYFNQDISSWNVGSVTNMKYMFYHTYRFNQDIGSWDVSNVVNMNSIFRYSIFNKEINNWDLSSVVDISFMFADSQFDQNISGWDLSNVTTMIGMFAHSKFNQNISYWDISKVKDMTRLFSPHSLINCSLNSLWNECFDERDIEGEEGILSTKNYNLLLREWSHLNVNKSIKLDLGATTYSTNFKYYRDILIDKFGWEILDGGEEENQEEIQKCQRVLLFESNIDFGEVAIGSSITKKLTIQNRGDCVLTINRLEPHNNIKDIFLGWENKKIRIAPNEQKTISITFIPTEEKLYSGEVYIDSDKTDNETSNCFFKGRGVSRRDNDFNLTRVTPLSPSNCKGYSIKKGVDKNKNLILDSNEITSTIDQYNEGEPISIEILRELVRNNDDLESINSCKITDMSNLFYNKIYHNKRPDISQWNTGSVINMNRMFAESYFKIDIGSWDISKVQSMNEIFINAQLSTESYNAILKGWSQQELQRDILLDMDLVKYSPNYQKYRDILTHKFGWTILDGGTKNMILAFGSHLKFGEVQVGESRTKELILYNKGDSPLHINGIRFHENLDGVYSGNWSGTVAPDSSKSITITFTPKEAKLYSGLVYVSSDKTNTTRENSRLLTGRGI